MCAATAFALQLPLRSSEDLVGYGQAVCRGFEQIASDRITGTDSQKKLGRMTQFVREKAATMITPWVLSDAVHAKMLDELRGRVYEVSPSTVKRYRHRAFTDIVQTIVDNHRTEIDAAFAAHGPRLLTRHKTHLMGALALCGYRMTLSAPVDSVRYALAANALRHEVNSEIIASLESTHRIPHNESTEHLLD